MRISGKDSVDLGRFTTAELDGSCLRENMFLLSEPSLVSSRAVALHNPNRAHVHTNLAAPDVQVWGCQ